MAQYLTYTVKRGDTLGGIARRNATTVGEIVALNGLSHPDRIVSGQVLNLRRAGTASYVVQPRDTLWAIARHYGVAVAELARASGIDPADPLQIGRKLTIPDHVPTPTFPPAAGRSLPLSIRAADVPRPGAASVKAAGLARARALPRSAGRCYRHVKQALLAGGAVDRYLGGGSAIEAGPELVGEGFVDIFGLPAAEIRSPYDAPVGAVLVYKATATATDKNRVHGHIEMRVEGGFASDYFSPRARTGPESNGTVLNSSSGRALAGVYVKPDRADAPAPAPVPAAQPPRPASAAAARLDPYSVANFKLDPLNGKYFGAITEAAERTGVAPQTVAAIIEAEVAMVPGTRQWDANSRSPTSSARGLMQFLNGTWIGEATRAGGLLNAEARAAGCVSADNQVTDRERLLQMRFDPRVSILAGADFAVANLAFLRARGVLPATVDPAGKAKLAYLAHHEGASGAVKFLRGDMSYVSTATFNANVPESKRAAALAAGGSIGAAYREYMGSYIDSRIVVTGYMISSEGVVVPRLRSFYLR